MAMSLGGARLRGTPICWLLSSDLILLALALQNLIETPMKTRIMISGTVANVSQVSFLFIVISILIFFILIELLFHFGNFISFDLFS